MILYINDEQIEFTLEQEQTLYDILISLEKEFKKDNASISSIMVNNNVILHNEEGWKQISIDQIQTLHIEADHSKITTIKQIQAIIQYLTILEHTASQSLPLQDISKADLLFILATIDTIGTITPTTHTPLQELLQYLLNTTGVLSNNVDEPLHPVDNMNVLFKYLYTTLEQRIDILLQEDEQWIQINTSIENHQELFHDIPKYLEHSKEVLGINQLIISIDLFNQWLHILSTPPKQIESTQVNTWNEEHKKYTMALKTFFEELADALESSDWVTINDLIEYEISPLIQEYTHIVRKYYPSSS